MGLKKMMALGVANEEEELSKASKAAEERKESLKGVSETSTREAISGNTVIRPQPSKSAQEKKSASIQTPTKKRGRPTNKERGIETREQYSITLPPTVYKRICSEAAKEKLSFATFVERVTLEYIAEKNKNL